MNDADPHSNPVPAPRKHPGIAGGRQIAPNQKHRFPLVAMRSVHIVFSPHAESPDSRIVVESPHPDPDRIGVIGIATEERRATVAAEPFLAPVFGLPQAKPVLARNDPKRAGCGMRVCGRRGAAPTLAALAMAVAGDEKRFGYLEAHGSAVAATREREAVQCPLTCF